MERLFWIMETDHSAIVATAIHSGHKISDYLIDKIALSEEERLREEDPYTDLFTHVVPNTIVVNHSRFEVDLNRPRTGAIYQKPEDAWGLHVWKTPLSKDDIEKSLAVYDRFYRELNDYFKKIQKNYENFIVLDIHSYNHHRQGPAAPFDDPELNPDINIGTETIKNPQKWRSLIDAVITEMHTYDYMGRHSDVRENVKFGGGYFAEWIHENFVPNVCVLSIEFKKFFMDEWTGKPDEKQLEEIQKLLKYTIPVIEKELLKIKEKHA